MSQDLLLDLVKDPTRVFAKEFKESDYFNQQVKQLLDSIAQYSKLDEVYIDGLDASQIFGQSKIVIENATDSVMGKLSELQPSEDEGEVSDDKEVSDPEEEDQEVSEDQEGEGVPESQEVSEEDSEIDEENLKDDYEEDDEEVETGEQTGEASDDGEIQVNKDAFGLNDEFFDIDQFNKQILSMENQDEDDGDEEIDYMADADADEDDDVDYYDDFYDKPNTKPSKQLIEDEEEAPNKKSLLDSEPEDDLESLNDEEYNNALGEMRHDIYEKSTFEKQQDNLRKEINELEDELVRDKKWTMKGEVNTKQRPEDSLLNDKEDFDFDRVSKPVPIVTEEMTETLEDLIRRRVKNEEFNDLPKRFLNDIVKPERQRTEVSETKSTKSLAEIYEDKYQGVENNEKEEKLTKDHEEIKQLFDKVNFKLDSLTSFNFKPKPIENDIIEIKNDTISMEDSQPEFVSNESRLAPQELFNSKDNRANNKDSNEISLKSGLSYSRDELSREDKQRLRRANKRKKSKQFKQSKKPKQDSVVDTLAGNKNLTIINKQGEKTDVRGNAKKQKTVASSNLKL